MGSAIFLFFFQIMLHIFVKISIIASPPAWTGSACICYQLLQTSCFGAATAAQLPQEGLAVNLFLGADDSPP